MLITNTFPLLSYKTLTAGDFVRLCFKHVGQWLSLIPLWQVASYVVVVVVVVFKSLLKMFHLYMVNLLNLYPTTTTTTV